MSNYRINPDNENISIQILMQRIDKGFKLQEIENSLTDEDIIEYNDSIIIAPDYQREYRFSLEDEIALIESVLAGIPIPPIFLATDKYKRVKVMNVVDGQHRLRALYRFKNDKFKLSKLKLLPEFEGKKYSELIIDDKADFNSVRLFTIIFKNFPGIDFELEIFKRYNKGTKSLSPQEIRHAVYNSEFNSYINDFTNVLYKSKDKSKENNILSKVYNVTKDRIQKKKVQEGIFVILNILEYGINKLYTKSLVYADNYMKEKAELEKDNPEKAIENFEFMKERFRKFNQLILKMQKYVEYPFSKELYGVSSRNYKFQISLAMVLAGVFHKIVQEEDQIEFIISKDSNLVIFLEVLSNSLKNSFIEDPNYNASSTNSEKLSELVEAISFENLI